MRSNNLPVPEVFAFMMNGTLFNSCFEKIPLTALSLEKDYFVKSVDGECASYVKHVSNFQSLCEINDEILLDKFIFQRKVIQHPQMNIINPYAINTLRIVTVYKGDNPYDLSALLRIGTKATQMLTIGQQEALPLELMKMVI